jgi:hypothetical protein
MNLLFSSNFPPGTILIPPLIIPDHIQRREEVQTPPPRQHANRWNTPVSLEVIENGYIRKIRWFSDLQMAWIYVQKSVTKNTNQTWNLRSFERTANAMDERWEDGRGDLGYVIAKSRRCKFRVFYEPDEEVSPPPISQPR